MLKIPCALTLVLALSGCAINQTVKPVEALQASEICLIENAAVRPGFIESYQRTLRAKGYATKLLPASAIITECTIASTYTANWQWDMAMYMSFAQIKVFRGGAEAGNATYDARGGGGNMNKFIDADKKITELVNQLFPGGAGKPPSGPSGK